MGSEMCLRDIPIETAIPFEYYGLATEFNGVDLLQTRHYTKVSCTSYIRRLLLAHAWTQPSPMESPLGSRPQEPVSPSAIAELLSLIHN